MVKTANVNAQTAVQQNKGQVYKLKTGPGVIKLFFMLNPAEHEIFSAYKYENANYIYENSNVTYKQIKFSCSVIFSKNKFVIVSNLRFISRTNFS